ncbi:Protein CBG00540 [Caenorhabditis briggsae]|uniref:Protein CBG00538 n=1 Tax=Caenorhabditis briggsae TaxID=6238 RepID=G2J6B3_CAEBR|nr:Protein CBG00538 [Caenorhabditis briggsae]XP_002630138.1 Protein CBG00540 [Caenorhabditis briggsae]CAP22086.1 Protein CBG00540 [Caenorhabditis briggsae]CAP22088.1 Protein CBG00538 [Caenorhabditis briggsae]
MDSGSDVEPPPKVSKTEILTPSRAQKLKELPIHIDFDHFQKSIDDGTFQFS